jgi:hypothetical protein
MKNILAMSAALSLVLWACGNESSSTGPELSSSSGIAESSSLAEESSGAQVAESSAESTGESSSAVVPESSGANPESSEAGPESSTVAESSSASDDVPCQVVDNMGGSCQNNNSSGDVILDGDSGGDQALPPVAIMTVENDSATYLVQNVRMPCEEIGGFAGMTRQLLKPTLRVTMDETEMHVEPVAETATSSSDCTCMSQFAFKIKLVSPFDQANLLVIDDRINQGNRMRIVTK